LNAAWNARRAQIDRTDVLEHVKAIAQLPKDAVVSDSYAAQIYGVPTNTIVQLRTRNLREWVEADAMGFDDILSPNAGKGRKPQQGHNRRGLLLLGMMLRDSEVAKNVRRLLLSL